MMFQKGWNPWPLIIGTGVFRKTHACSSTFSIVRSISRCVSLRGMFSNSLFMASIRGTVEKTVAKQAADLRRCAFHVNGEPPVEMKDFYDLHGDELNDTGLEPAGEVER